MAKADYKLCDVCGEKAFYDAHLNYECGISKWGLMPFRQVGKQQYSDPELTKKYGDRLDFVGDWAVVCAECAKTHRVQIVPIENEAQHDNQD